MHKKYHKFGNKDLHRKHSSSKREHVRHQKEHESNNNDLIRAPQNSISEIHDKRDTKDHIKSKHKHREHSKYKKLDKTKLSEHYTAKLEEKPDKQSRSKSEGQKKIKSIENVTLKNGGGVEHINDKADKRDKDRLNKIEQYFEGINKFYNQNKGQTRLSRSMRSSEIALKQKEKDKHIRREKTFHAEKNKRDESKESPKTKTKKHGHKEEKDKEASKERNVKKLQKQVMYCHVDVQKPFETAARNIPVENLYPNEHNKAHKGENSSKTRKHSGSRDRREIPSSEGARYADKSSKGAHHHPKRARDRGTLDSAHLAPRMSQVKANLKHNQTKSAASLGPYHKYFVFDKISPTEIDKGKQKQHRKTSAKDPKGEQENNVVKESKKKKSDRHKPSMETRPSAEKDQYREKIEDDLKTYFTKIQTLIDKKLDYILKVSSKESNLRVKEVEVLPSAKAKHKKENLGESKQEEVPASQRTPEEGYTHPKKKRKSRKRNKAVEGKKVSGEPERGSKNQDRVTMLKNDIQNEEGVKLHKQKQEDFKYHKSKEDERMRYQKQKEEERLKQKKEEIRHRKQIEEDMLTYQKQRDEEIRHQKLKDEEMRHHKQKEEEMRRQKLKEEEIVRLKQKEEEMRRQRQKEEEAIYNKQKEETLRHQIQQEEEMGRHKQKEEEMKHHKQKEEERRRHGQKEEDMKHHRHKEEETRHHKHIEDEIRHRKSSEEDLYHLKHHRSPKKFPSVHERISQHQLTVDESRRYKQKQECDRNINPAKIVNLVQDLAKYSYSKEQVTTKEFHEDVQYEDTPRHKALGDIYHNRDQRERNSAKNKPEERRINLDIGHFLPDGREPECRRIKSKRRLKRLNLECKTISIVGIPSQLKESATFDGTQTTTSLNVVNPIEDALELKKQSRRFKLYYKYSMGNNKPPSGHSSDGKSIISDSYRIVSDPSEHASDLWVDNNEDVKEEERGGSGKVLFIMKGETSGNECGDITNGHNIVVRKSRMQRVTTPSASMLNNIIEEPSNVSFSAENHDVLQCLSHEVDCTFFNMWRSSSSDCNMHVNKKTVPRKVSPARKVPILPVAKHVDNVKKTVVEKSGHLAASKPLDKKIKVRAIKSHHKLKPKPIPDSGARFSSKSDIDISYDSLHLSKHYSVKVNKGEIRPILKNSLAQKTNILKIPVPVRIQHVKNADSCRVVGEEEMCMMVQTTDGQQQTAPLRIPKFEELRSKTGYVEQAVEASKKQHVEVETRNLHSAKKTPAPSVTRIPSLVIKRNLPDARDLAYMIEEMELLKKQVNSEKVKKYVDVGTEINTETTIVHEVPCPCIPAIKIARPKTPNKDGKLITCHRRGYMKTFEMAVEASIDPEQTLAVQMKNSLKNDQATLWEPKAKGALAQECRRRNHSADATQVPVESTPGTPKIIHHKGNIPRPLSALDKLGKFPKTITAQKPMKKPLFNRTKTTLTAYDIAKRIRHSREVNTPCTPRGRSVGTSSIKIKEQPPRDKSVGTGTSSIKVEQDLQQVSAGTSWTKDRDDHDRTYFEGDSSDSPSTSVALNMDPDTKRRRQIRSLSCSEKSSRVNKYNTLSTSKSEMSVFNLNVESNITSMVCLDKFLHSAKAGTYSSNSHPKSLDRYTGYTAKSIIGDQPHVSRLFLTKSFSPQINSYQRRKMYSEALRQKVFKKKGTEIVKEGTEAANHTKCHSKNSSSKTSTFVCKSKTVRKAMAKKLAPKPCVKNSKKHIGVSKENVLKFSGRNIFTPVITNPSLTSELKEEITHPERVGKKTDEHGKVVEELKEEAEAMVQAKQDTLFEYFKKLDDIKSSSLLLKDTGASLEDFKRKLASASSDGGETDQNFLQLVDYLYKSIVTYCNSRFSLIQQDHLPAPSRKSGACSRTSSSTEMRNSIQHRPSIPTIAEQSFINPKSDEEEDSEERDVGSSEAAMEPKRLNSKSQDTISKPVTQPPKVCSHVSCPALAETAPSFEFLYEDESVDLTKETILAKFTKPDTFLGYALDSTVPVNPKVFAKKLDQFSNFDSESGYTSNSSKKCSSVNSFFKKANVAALLRPERLPLNCKIELDARDSTRLLGTSVKSYGPTKEEYNNMVQKCQEYAQKVRIECQRNTDLDEEYEEIPLNVLLQKRSSSMFENCASSCSLSRSFYSDETNDSYDKTNVAAVAKSKDAGQRKKSDTALVQGKNESETVVYFENNMHKHKHPSLEIISVHKSHIEIDAAYPRDSLLREMMDCKVVVSSTNLSRGSITIIDSAQMRGIGNPFAEDIDDGKELDRLKKLAKPTEDLDMALDSAMINSLLNKQYVDIPIKMKKLLAKKFFENLLNVYEREIAVTSQLFQDEDFFVNHLMGAVRPGAEGGFKKQAKEKSKSPLGGRIRQYFSNVFSARNSNMGSKTQVDVCNAFDKSIVDQHQEELQMLARNARRYFSLFVQAVRANKDMNNDEMKICGLLKLLERIEHGDFTILRKEEEPHFEEEIKDQVKQAFLEIYTVAMREAKKNKRTLSPEDLELIRTFLSKYRIALLSKTDLIASYIGRGVFKSENELKAAVTYLVRLQTKDIDSKDFDNYCQVFSNNGKK